MKVRSQKERQERDSPDVRGRQAGLQSVCSGEGGEREGRRGRGHHEEEQETRKERKEESIQEEKGGL